MAKVIISKSLEEEILRKFKSEAEEIFLFMKTLENQPQKGKSIGHVAEVVIKELKYKKFRLYFITDGYMLKFGTSDELASLLIKFVRMSEKKNQQRTINEIKIILKSLGLEGL